MPANHGYRILRTDVEFPSAASNWKDIVPEHSKDVLEWAAALKVPMFSHQAQLRASLCLPVRVDPLLIVPALLSIERGAAHAHAACNLWCAPDCFGSLFSGICVGMVPSLVPSM